MSANLGSFFLWVVPALLGVALVGFVAYRLGRQFTRLLNRPAAPKAGGAFKTGFNVSYVPSDMEWSGSTNTALPLKTLTYKQYECLEDARYGFRVIGVKPSARHEAQPHKTRAHGLKTVASLLKHGFIASADQDGGHVITDHGLNALEVCDVRY